MKITIFQFKVTWYEGELHFHCDDAAGSVILLHADRIRETKAIIEAFAGLGGWSNAVSHMGAKVHMMIEQDVDTARVCACQFDIPIYTADEYIETVLSGKKIRDCVLNASMTSPRTWMAIGLSNPRVVLASPPCQPWSGAGNSSGLLGEDGQSMLATLGWAGQMEIECVVLENVPGICKHQDYAKVIEEAKKDGMKLTHANTFSCHQLLPVRRDRWIAVFCHCKVDVQTQDVQNAAAVSFSCPSLRQVCCQPSVGQANALHVNMSEVENKQLQIDEHMYAAMGNPRYAPNWLAAKTGSKSPDDLVQARVITRDQQISAVMAAYGSQHKLSDELLSSKGLHMMIINDGTNTRLFSPWEMVAVQGYPTTTVLHQDLHKSWKLAGNGITVAHAWLALTKAHIILHDMSPFAPEGSIQDQVYRLLHSTIKLSQFETVIEGDFWMLVAKETTEPDAKKAKISVSPTIQFKVDEPEETVVTTKKFEKAPAFQYGNDARQVAVFGENYSNGVVMLQHEQKHWLMFLNMSRNDTIGNLIQKGLPHARAEHFEWLAFDNSPVEWNQAIMNGHMKTLVFSPCCTLINCTEQSLNIALQLRGDVTWTARTALAFCAAKLGCNSDAVVLSYKGNEVKDDDFLVEFPERSFQIAFQAKLPAYVDLAPVATKPADPGIAPAPSSFIRVYARHPLRKSIRTVSISLGCTVKQMVQMLFPDLHASTPWTPFSEGETIPLDTYASAWTQIVIQWDTLRPLRTTEVSAIMFKEGLDSPVTQTKLALHGVTRHMRSPFEVKAKQYHVHPNMSVGDVGATYLCHTQVQATMLCTINGAVVDPTIVMSEIAAESTMNFRLCPLLGGGKADQIKKRIQEMLTSKGVPEAEVQERLNALIAKCPADKFLVYKDDSDEQFWENTKKLASEAKFRLIKPDELKQFQKNQRQGSSAKGSNHVKKETTKQNKPTNRKHEAQAQAHEVVVDTNHFAAAGEPITLLEPDRFGPDQTGLCIVSVGQAMKLIREQYKSSDPLALLIIGKGAEQFGQTFSLPAHTHQGNPTILTASLVNCGDVDIEFVLRIPKVNVNQTASTVIEFCIERSHVSQWSATTIPLHYIGVHIPPLRGNNLLAVWAVKAWQGKKLSNVSQATHWHGFFRVNDSLLPQVLKRSGPAGIFLWPKSETKRHDPRFIIIPMANGTLKDAIGKAEACKESLGIVKINDGLALRCRREDASLVRSQVMPETAFVEMAPINHEDELFVMKHAPAMSREELTRAIQAAGWTAEAVKTQGASRWLIASQESPPGSHLVINNSLVIIERLNGQKDKPAVIATASEYKVDTLYDANQQVMQVTTTSRFAELRTEIEEHVASVVETKMAEANSQINALTQALQEAQRQNESNLAQVRVEQEFTKAKITEVEQSVAASSQNIVQQMQQMFAKMEQSMTNKMEQTMSSEKRPRLDDKEEKKDPFASH
eukprot:Skav214681  [mRNA]  locus=scaffold923:733843:738186:- [translate_table: standard]